MCFLRMQQKDEKTRTFTEISQKRRNDMVEENTALRTTNDATKYYYTATTRHTEAERSRVDGAASAASE